jgi:hypothetical protein
MATEVPNLSDDLTTGLLQLVEALDQFRLRYALIGGVGAGYRSIPRFTEDLDFLLDIPQLVLPGLLEDLHARGFDFDTNTTIHEWTREHLTALSFRGVRIDWLKPILPCYRHILDQARAEEWFGCSIRIALPEGLILTKLLAFRGQDQVDIENLLAANRGQLDLEWIRQEWSAIAALDDSRFQWFNNAVSRLYLPPPQQTTATDT